ncbi:MAG: serine protease [Minicystis sp.]
MPSPRSCLAAASVLALALAACQEAAPPKAPASPAKPAPAASATPAAAAGRLKRPEVDQVLVQNGPPWVLRRILSEEVLSKDGKFMGWRLVGLPEEWRGIDLKPGDIVMRINGLPLETPDQAWEAWKSVAKTPDLRITVMRDGAAREVVLPIDGALSAETLKLLDRGAPPQRAAAPAGPPPRKGSVQIGGGGESGEEESF